MIEKVILKILKKKENDCGLPFFSILLALTREDFDWNCSGDDKRKTIEDALESLYVKKKISKVLIYDADVIYKIKK